MTRTSNGERLAAELRRAWNGDPWHGPSASVVLARLTARQAARRRARGSHTAWELVLHLTTWVEAPLRRLDDPAFEPSDDEDFPVPNTSRDDQWTRDVAALGDAVERLARRVETLPDAVLESPVGARAYTYITMFDGVAQHLAYHAGQAAVLALTEETAGVVAPPPVIVLLAVAAAEGLHRVIALPLAAPSWIGYLLGLAGMLLVWWAHEHFVRSRTPAAPWIPARFLVLGGPYRFMRNPMYVGLLMAMAGAAFMRGVAWHLVLLPAAWAALHWGVVLREERYLLKRFGEPYQLLLDRSRRWLV